MSEIIYLSKKMGTPGKGYWDQTFINDILMSLNVESDRTIVIIPGAYQGELVHKINEFLSQYKKVLVFITSDEEGKFDCGKLWHPDIIHYRQYGYCEHNRLFPIGYTSDTRKILKKIGLVEKDIDNFYAGQLNSDERRNLASFMVSIPKTVFFGTDGFSRGLPQDMYYDYLAHAKYAPAPGGHVSPDSFRFYEALEAGCIPVQFPRYLADLFPDIPFDPKKPYQQNANNIFAWWQKQKMLLRQKIKDDLDIHEAMTIVVSTSPIKSHPSTDIIDQTIKSIRHHTPMDIILMIDGVRDEQKNMSNDYTEYIRRLLWKCNFEYENVMPLLFEKHLHQSGMLRETLPYIKTPLMMYVEHDTPLVTDEPIDWEYISQSILDSTANVVRLHYEAVIPEVHKPLMIPEKDRPFLMATRQWSQRPHVARTHFYREIMKFFSPNANCFIEDFIYGQCLEANWDLWKLFIYNPGKNLKRSLNLDGRAGGQKFDDRQIW